MSDVWFFNCIDFNWFKADLNGIAPPARHSQSAVLHNNSIFIFGGIGEKN